MIPRRKAAQRALLMVALAACSGESTEQDTTPIVLSESAATVGAGASFQLLVYAREHSVSDAPLGGTVTWTTSDAGIVDVDAQGTVHGKKLGGPVTITATRYGHAASASVVVIPAVIDITPRVGTLAVGTSLQLTATPLDANGVPLETAAPAWALSFPTGVTSASITSTGKLTVTAPGLFTVGATMGGGHAHREIGAPSVFDGVWTGIAPGTIGVEFVVRYGVVSGFRLPTTVRQACTRQVLSLQTAVIGADNRFTLGLPSLPNIVSGTFTGEAAMTGAYTEIPTIDGCGGIQEGPVPAATFAASR